MKSRVALEVARVLGTGGARLLYDFRFNEASNPHVRGVTRKDIERLFPGFWPWLQTMTLLPPLARRLGRHSSTPYPPMSPLPFLPTHYLGLLSKS